MSTWKILSEAFDDDEDLTALARRFKTGPSVTDKVTDPKGTAKYGQDTPQKSAWSSFSSGETPDDTAGALKAAGLNAPLSNTQQQHQQSQAYTKAWMMSSRYADQVIAIDDRKDMAELITTFAAGMQHKRPLSPQLMGRYVGKLLLAHTEDQARGILMDLTKEIMGEKK